MRRVGLFLPEIVGRRAGFRWPDHCIDTDLAGEWWAKSNRDLSEVTVSYHAMRHCSSVSTIL